MVSIYDFSIDKNASGIAIQQNYIASDDKKAISKLELRFCNMLIPCCKKKKNLTKYKNTKMYQTLINYIKNKICIK